MARKKVERNISYDDVRKVYYVSMDLGRDENGKRIKQYKTFPNIQRTGRPEGVPRRAQAKLTHHPPPHYGGPMAGVLDGYHRAAQPGGNNGVRLPEDH